LSTYQSFKITVYECNCTPISISSTPDLFINEDELYRYEIIASSEFGHTLDYSVTEKPDWLTFTPVSGILSGIPVNDDAGEYDVVLKSVMNSGLLNSHLPLRY